MMYIVTTCEAYLENVQNIGVFDSKDRAKRCLEELGFKETNKQTYSGEWIWESLDKEKTELWASIQELVLNEYAIPDSWLWDEEEDPLAYIDEED